MKTSNVLIRLCILVLVFTPFLTTTEVSAQPPCPPGTPCGVHPNCYAAPKVSCPDQLDHLIDHNCCDPQTQASLCDPGLFICISTQIPEVWANCHNCSGALDCKYIYIRNSTYCGGATYPAIAKIEYIISKDQNSSEYVMCGPKKQWGVDPWDDSTWSIESDNYGPIASGACKSWTGFTTDTLETDMNTEKGSSYFIEQCNHYTAVLCGADIVAIRVHYVSSATSGITHTTPWFNSLTIHSAPCPEYGDDHEWCP